MSTYLDGIQDKTEISDALKARAELGNGTAVGGDGVVTDVYKALPFAMVYCKSI